MSGPEQRWRARMLIPLALTAMALATSLALQAQIAAVSSATYDEVAYLEIGCDWFLHGQQERIARMGSPLSFWKVQQVATLWWLGRTGHAGRLERPIANQAWLLPLLRRGALWIPAAALLVMAAWAGWVHGRWGMALAAWLFALSPNLLAHGSLITMEMPLVLAWAGACALFAVHLRSGRRWAVVASAVVAGVGFSFKFTIVLLPVLLAAAWWLERVRCAGRARAVRLAAHVCAGLLAYGLIMLAANLAVTGGARLTLSEGQGAHPALSRALPTPAEPLVRWLAETSWPQDWVAFARQVQHQRSGGPSYLLGQTRERGWWYYYLVALGVKVPLGFFVMLLGRLCLVRRAPLDSSERMAIVIAAGFLVIVAVGSSRNYGFRYLLPLAASGIVVCSGLARAGRLGVTIAVVGLAGQAFAVASIHPHELSYFNAITGGPEGGKWILADSNLDWGQGARSLARLQRQRPDLNDLTLFYFGATDPAHYAVAGQRYVIDAHEPWRRLPEDRAVPTRHIAVSRSLEYGPWGPPGYFEGLRDQRPLAVTDDHTIAVYGAAALGGP